MQSTLDTRHSLPLALPVNGPPLVMLTIPFSLSLCLSFSLSSASSLTFTTAFSCFFSALCHAVCICVHWKLSSSVQDALRLALCLTFHISQSLGFPSHSFSLFVILEPTLLIFEKFIIHFIILVDVKLDLIVSNCIAVFILFLNKNFQYYLNLTSFR